MLKWFGVQVTLRLPNHSLCQVATGVCDQILVLSFVSFCLGFAGASSVTWRWVCPMMEVTAIICCSNFLVLHCYVCAELVLCQCIQEPLPFQALHSWLYQPFFLLVLGNLIVRWLLINESPCIICKSCKGKSVFTCIMFYIYLRIYHTVFSKENSKSSSLTFLGCHNFKSVFCMFLS
jgi:hypothetical protein